MKTFYRAARLFTAENFIDNALFSVEKGVFNLETETTDPVIELDGLVAPGFIDVQVNGGGGAFFNADQSTECLDRIAKAHGQFGSTALMPTLITDKVEVMQAAADATAKAIREGVPGVLGIHFEGPHLSFPKKGTHSEQFIRPISEQEFAIYARQDLGIKMVTLAPENVSIADVERLVACGVKVSIGHTNADYATTIAALNAGADGFTHLYNAMSPFTSREPGVVGAALWHDNSWCGLIVDGHHVHPLSAQLAIRTKQRGKIMLVTDAMPPVGTDDMEFDFFDGRKVIRTGDRLNSSTGELAGSVLDMASAVRNTVNTLDVSLSESLRMAALYPAQYLDLKKKGRLLDGFDADFVVLDEHQYVKGTYIAGIAI
ncbi:N-acetylglucosamine 6-phosphate deacetylase [Pseudoalteromonas porphyrae]|uniref:N-acetylgalactosamine-6-phosphate deacetylase n=2 Tax=Pseudoalteromonas TaxID=53246 RepID=A0A0N1MSF3_9GAMM|nr:MULTISPECIES: N-acetylglucosamine-6-phosphate deacetylase [Pseudoalteromonas]KPH59100.1 N-acetylglucosamine 6-phosphate deacetylase [Pseudoalteromonas porphyrae]KPH94050.1 N-acetylglucosamine 6-phosphate deacetylase [Pseudoalteromonas porphyrae]NNG42803.1 N-acetylglucosamine-6-phosphate deacetylase [Pseudoalteromonas sp. NEC-BIFX-2020_002]